MTDRLFSTIFDAGTLHWYQYIITLPHGKTVCTTCDNESENGNITTHAVISKKKHTINSGIKLKLSISAAISYELENCLLSSSLLFTSAHLSMWKLYLFARAIVFNLKITFDEVEWVVSQSYVQVYMKIFSHVIQCRVEGRPYIGLKFFKIFRANFGPTYKCFSGKATFVALC